jgi:hypothetical protein
MEDVVSEPIVANLGMGICIYPQISASALRRCGKAVNGIAF